MQAHHLPNSQLSSWWGTVAWQLQHLGQLEDWHQFKAARHWEEAVDFENGGYHVATYCPGLLFVQQRALTTTWQGCMANSLSFSAAHNAVELAHGITEATRCITLDTRPYMHQLGVVAKASSVIVYTSGNSDIRASQLVCDIVTVDTQSIAISLAETILQAGSQPTPCLVLLQPTSPLMPRLRARQ